MTISETTTKIKARVNKVLANPNVRFGLVLVSIGAGAYFGTGAPMREISKNVKRIDTNLYETGKFLGDAYSEQMEFRIAQRVMINEALENGRGFTHFAGVGVLDHDQFEVATGKKVK
jgi:hypothetical protein